MTPQSPQTPAPRVPRSASRVVAISTIALGAAVGVGAVLGSAVPTVAAALERTEQSELAVAGIDELDIDVAAATFTLRFDDVDEASLEVRGAGVGSWTLRRDDDALRVSSPNGPFAGWFGNGNGRAVLTLPRVLEGADADIRSGAGALFADGRFGELDLEIGAGQVTVAGSAEALTAQLGAGRGDFDLEGVRTADLEVSAGSVTARLGGDAPDEVEISVSAGSLDLTLPDAEYDVTSDVSAGDFTHDLRTSGASSHRVHASVSAGDATVSAE